MAAAPSSRRLWCTTVRVPEHADEDAHPYENAPGQLADRGAGVERVGLVDLQACDPACPGPNMLEKLPAVSQSPSAREIGVLHQGGDRKQLGVRLGSYIDLAVIHTRPLVVGVVYRRQHLASARLSGAEPDCERAAETARVRST